MGQLPPVWPEIERPEFLDNDAIYVFPGGTYRGPVESITWQSVKATGWEHIQFAWLATATADETWEMVHPGGWSFDARPSNWSGPEVLPDGSVRFTFLRQDGYFLTFLAGTTPNLDPAAIRAGVPGA